VLPMMLDLGRLAVALVGNGAAALRRLERLEEAGAHDIAVYAAAPSAALAAAAGARLVRRAPSAGDLAAARLVFIADQDLPELGRLLAAAYAVGTLVHVEDAPLLSDMQAPAVVRRGDLTIAVSTGGASPAVAMLISRFLGTIFGPEWRERLDEVAGLRRRWREAGMPPPAIARRTEAWVDRRGWLPTALFGAFAPVRHRRPPVAPQLRNHAAPN
jgi:precorrin-2 dehydrogenase / sirohydrochlorin ferrochelatase